MLANDTEGEGPHEADCRGILALRALAASYIVGMTVSVQLS